MCRWGGKAEGKKWLRGIFHGMVLSSSLNVTILCWAKECFSYVERVTVEQTEKKTFLSSSDVSADAVKINVIKFYYNPFFPFLALSHSIFRLTREK